jgi:very-long-chain (3R)-3-hydroxyacyl-CoA dehydratase
MILSWSITEVVRYAFYACNLLGKEPYLLFYLRYTTFYVLYPLGAASEAFLIYSTLPKTALGYWKLTDYQRGVLFAIWWPGTI